MDVDSSSDESSFDDEENWSDEESQIFESDMDDPIDCSFLESSLPNSFLDLPPDLYDCLDSDLVSGIGNQDPTIFAWEHHLFVKGLLQLLAERDMIGVEDDVRKTHNITKMGVLRKKDATIGWRVKYVEVRRGNLTYFADKKESEIGRTVHLRKRSCSCKIKTTPSREAGQDFVFELIVDGGKRLLWTAQSEEECQGWVRAINHAMIGDVDDSRDLPLDLTLYQTAISDYRSVHGSMKEASTRQEYLVATNTLLYRQTSSSALRVPMRWIRDTYLCDESPEGGGAELPMKDHERIKRAVRDFWKNLCNNPIVLNGNFVEAGSPYSGERVIGALARCILEFDKVENNTDADRIVDSLKRSRHLQHHHHCITELEAVSYARNILSGALQSASQGDIRSAVEELFRNDGVQIHAILESSEPLHVYVSYAGDDFSESKMIKPTETVGWIETKSKKSKKWKMRYFVATSEGVLSFFERAEPRPYKLAGQMVLHKDETRLTILEGNILSLEVQQNRERWLRFDDRGELIRWKSILESCSGGGAVLELPAVGEQELETTKLVDVPLPLPLLATDDQTEPEPESEQPQYEEEAVDDAHSRDEDSSPPQEPPLSDSKPDETTLPSSSSAASTSSNNNNNNNTKPRRNVVRGAGARILKKATLAKNGMKRARDKIEIATGNRMMKLRSMRMRTRTGAGMLFRRNDNGNGRRRLPTSDMLLTSTRSLNCFSSSSEKREPTVQAVVETNKVFRVVASQKGSEKNGDDSDGDGEVLLMVRAKLYQAFLLSGGPHGRLACGDELLLMEFSEGEGAEDVQNFVLFQAPTSL